jgi:hypothetical protein
VRNEAVLQSQGRENNLRTIKRRKANWIGHILRRNCLLNHITVEKTLGTSDGKARKNS